MTDTQADSYGGVVVSGGGKVLLREPASHFGGYVWTFAKGRPDAGETPLEAALREVLEETGYAARSLAPIPGSFAGTTGSTAFFLMDALHPPAAHGDETASLRWVSFDEARKLLRLTKTPMGRKRDLQILDAAERVLGKIPYAAHPNVQPEDYWAQLFALPKERRSLKLEREFDADEMQRLRRGYFPRTRKQTWFVCFSGEQLCVFRSWTGILAFDVSFAPCASGAARIRQVLLNTDPMQVGTLDDEEALKQLAEVIDRLLLDPRPDAADGELDAGAWLAPQPDSLGSAEVVKTALAPVFTVALKILRGEAGYEEGLETNKSVALLFSDDQLGYTRVPDWHTQDALGQGLIKHMGLNGESCEGKNLQFLVSEALASLHLKIRELLLAFQDDANAQWNPDALRQLNALHEFATAVFVGTQEAAFPGRHLGDFTWEAVAPEAP